MRTLKNKLSLNFMRSKFRRFPSNLNPTSSPSSKSPKLLTPQGSSRLGNMAKYFSHFWAFHFQFKKNEKIALRYRVLNLFSKFDGNRLKTVEVMGVNVGRLIFYDIPLILNIDKVFFPFFRLFISNFKK